METALLPLKKIKSFHSSTRSFPPFFLIEHVCWCGLLAVLSFHYKLDFPQRSSKFCVFQFFYVLISRYTNPKYNKDQPCKLRTCIFMIQIWKIGTSVLWRRRYHWLFIQWEISPPAACVPAHSSCSQTPPCFLQSTADRWSLLCSSHCSSHSWQTHSESVSRGTLTMWVDAHASWTSSVGAGS